MSLETTPSSDELAAAPKAQTLASTRRTILRRITDSVIVYDPTPLPRPHVDVKLSEMSVVPRVLEVLRYNLFCLEYALGNDGWVRGVALSTFRALLLVVMPLLALLAITFLLIPIFGGLATITASLSASIYNIALGILWAIAIIVLLPLAIGISGVVWKHRRHWAGQWESQNPARRIDAQVTNAEWQAKKAEQSPREQPQ